MCDAAAGFISTYIYGEKQCSPFPSRKLEYPFMVHSWAVCKNRWLDSRTFRNGIQVLQNVPLSNDPQKYIFIKHCGDVALVLSLFIPKPSFPLTELNSCAVITGAVKHNTRQFVDKAQKCTIRSLAGPHCLYR